ncbi:hypothetical protein AAFF_G00126360 [Aldrovandia affinis]|uniref:C2H2-type domain-containing protein n=1 Tax=Aldrovandia affinis TaxID=143900 RepID=A0AAD7RRJ7_9TELE|nr:hypothetical protein AAFF_G00126360 [Aldrovandia affinis]
MAVISSSSGKEQGGKVNKGGNVVEAERDSEETDDSDVSEEEEEDDDEEEEVASDTSADSLAEQCCRVCGLTLPSALQLREHMHLHSGARPHRCAECGKQFCHLTNYRAHLRSHAQAPTVRCRICEASFESEESLAHHLENSHFEKEFYQCDYCKRVFTCLKECHQHVDLHRRVPRLHHQCPKCERHFRRRKSLARHMEAHARRRSYLCTDCGQAFDRKNVLFRHSFSHLGLLPYTCVRCRRHFRLASLYRKHVCEPERIQCVACLGFFRSQEDFQRHKEETGCWGHQGARRDGIRCMECGESFQSSEELRKHGGAHQRVLTCSECGKGFRSALLLMSHMGGHAGQRPCLCQHCGLGFPHQQAYDSHHKDCGRATPTPVAAKKQKTKPTTPEKVDIPPQGVWKLTLDKCPPPGSSLVVFLPVPAGSPSPGLPELASTLPVGSSLAQDLQMQATVRPIASRAASAQDSQERPSAAMHQAPLTAVVMGPSTITPERLIRGTHPTPVTAALVGATTSPQERPSGTVCHGGSLPVPGTTLKLQISEATFVPGLQQLPEAWEHSKFFQPMATGDGAQPPGVPLSHGTAAGPTHPQMTVHILGGPGAPAGLVVAGGPVLAAGTATTRDQVSSKGRNWATAQKEKRVEEEEEEEVWKEGGIVAKEGNVQQGGVLSNLKVESLLVAERGVMGHVEYKKLVPREGETPMYLKIELPAQVRSEMASGSLKGSSEADSYVPGWSGPAGSGMGPWGPKNLPPATVKHETGADKGTDAEREGACRGGLASGVMREDGGEGFESVEVEIRDEEAEGEQEVDGEPHECVSCGKILLEGDLIQHYMQHALESDSALHDPSHKTLSSTPSPLLLLLLLPSCEPPPKKEIKTP